jgi:hypothetical protein
MRYSGIIAGGGFALALRGSGLPEPPTERTHHEARFSSVADCTVAS